jgi:hypothetical protein
MTRCHECDAALDSMTELARHECEPTIPTPEEAKRIRAAGRRRSAEEQEARRERDELEFEWR